MILIKNMDVPKRCSECEMLKKFPIGLGLQWCDVAGKLIGKDGKRPDECPIEEVEEHEVRIRVNTVAYKPVVIYTPVGEKWEDVGINV